MANGSLSSLVVISIYGCADVFCKVFVVWLLPRQSISTLARVAGAILMHEMQTSYGHSLSNVIVVDEKNLLSTQYVVYCQKRGTILFSIQPLSNGFNYMLLA